MQLYLHTQVGPEDASWAIPVSKQDQSSLPWLHKALQPLTLGSASCPPVPFSQASSSNEATHPLLQ